MTKRFGEVAIELGIVTPEQVATALTMQAEQERSGQPRSKIGELLKELSSLNDEQINRVLARMREVPLTNGLGKTEAVSASPGPAAAAELMALEPGQKLGHFSVRRFHARGGLGQVWVVYDELLGRDVALKVMRPELESNPQARRRFLNEAQIAGQLEHPNIVPVYELGCTPEGRPYYAMKFVPGRTLADSIRRYHARPVADPDASLEWRKLLEAFVGVCRAIAYAHEHGVIHRDLKPSNVMWGDYGEAVVLDWGLAKRLPGSGSIVQSQPPADEMKEPIHEPNKLTKSSETSEVFGSAVKLQVAQSAILASLQEQTDRTSTDPEDAHQPPTPPEAGITRTGDVLGIVPFMPPEQAAGDVDQVDARSDVYSLGAMLYAILTNRRPFTETDKARLLVQVLEQEPPRPRQVNGRVPRPLAAICLKAMARHKAGRYATAQELAHDVERWLADEPVSVYRGGWNERLARWARRNRSRATAAMTALLLITFISAWAAIMIHSASQETERQRIQ
ncbi:MAG: serine/threonine protein kinase, partial [Planctomycetes bacterium]|nr:serine/threonine protein kinase [Planctomycetota bacterium]